MTLWFQRVLSASLVFQSWGYDSEKVEVRVERMAAAESLMSEWSKDLLSVGKEQSAAATAAGLCSGGSLQRAAIEY